MTRQHAHRSTDSIAAPTVATSHDTVGKRTLVDAVQHRVEPAAPGRGPEAVAAAAAHGTSGPAQPLPHLSRVQQLFGRHDVTSVRAHVGGSAAEGATAMGAQAYATGDHVAFAGAPDLHTAAHEAAHVVQQRAGVQLKGGVGEVGDPYERHADAVADAVVAGQSAEALLDDKAPAAGSAPQRAAIQRKQGIERSESFSKEPRLKQASILIYTAVMKTPALEKFFTFLKSDDNHTFVELDTYEDPGGAFGKTNVLVSIEDTFRRIDLLNDEGLAKVNDKTEVMIRVLVNTAKLDKPIGGGGKEETVGINEVINTVAHEIALHAAKFQSLGQAIQSGSSGAALDKLLTDKLKPGEEFDDAVAHTELLAGTNPAYEELQNTVITMMKDSPKPGHDAERYQRDIARDRAAQAMAMRLKKYEERVAVLHPHIVEQFKKAAAGDSIDRAELTEAIQAVADTLEFWGLAQSDLLKEYPLLKHEAALTFFDGKHAQLIEKHKHITELSKTDKERRQTSK